jgi:hypothetical protein
MDVEIYSQTALIVKERLVEAVASLEAEHWVWNPYYDTAENVTLDIGYNNSDCDSRTSSLNCSS